MDDIKLTPMMQQYRKIKKAIPSGSILLFRLGDFYEMFFEDAKTAAGILNIALTRRSKEEGRDYPMCGIPYHAAEAYIGRLIKAGYKVAVCDQVEDPKLAKGIVRRDVTRLITPGTILNTELLDNKLNNFLAAFNKLGAVYGFCYLDMSTGEFRVTELASEEDFLGEFTAVAPSECVLPSSFKNNKSFLDRLNANREVLMNFYDDWVFDYDSCYSSLREHFHTQSLDGFGCQGYVPGITAAGAVIHYLKENLHKSLSHIKNIVPYSTKEYMVLDGATIKNLDLAGTNNKSTLLGVLDYTSTSMGARLLQNWIKQPLIKAQMIGQRQDAVKELYENKTLLCKLGDLLKEIPDMLRLVSRVDCGYANARDLIAIKDALKVIPELKKIVSDFKSQMITGLNEQLTELPDLIDLLERSIVPNPPMILREGGFIKEGFNKELDDLINIFSQAKGWLSNMQVRETERTGIKSLKVRYNKVFGYYIEVSNSNLSAVPSDYIRKQTLANAERYITPELKEYETKILNAEEERFQLEYDIFQTIRQDISKQTAVIQKTAGAVAIIDVIAGLAQAALRNNYIFPEINDSSVLSITNGRHPVLERFLEEGRRFIPNDTYLDSKDNQLIIITGPNMAGKSTYIRQVAMLTLMAQIGSAIPAERASMGVVDRIFTRVGARDDITKGQSTFMVEMNETAYILNNATPKSLIVLDEIGRGTSTYDGISIAWAVAEYLVRNQKNTVTEGDEFLGPKTLFATHYHELTELRESAKGVQNYNIAVREWNDEIIFLYKIVQGGTDKSYGIHVGRLAGLPYQVLERAKEILSGLEEGSISWKKDSADKTGPQQLFLFDTPNNQLAEELQKIKLDFLTPIEAMNKLKELKEKAIN